MKRIFKRLGIFIENKTLLLIILGLVLIVPAVFGATHLKMETGTSTFISSSSPEYQAYARFNSHFSSDVLIVLLTGSDLNQLLDPSKLAAMDSFQTQMAQYPGVVSSIGPAFLIKQAVFQQSGSASLPKDTQTSLNIVTDPTTGQIRPQFSSIFPDNQHALIAITLGGDLSQKDQAGVVLAAKAAVNQSGLQTLNPIVTGSPVIWSAVNDLITSSMKNMLLVSIGLMLLILLLIFHVSGFFAWRWLPLGVVFLGIAYAFGIMGLLSIPITMVSMAVFPIIIGLGVDYSIQFHNRYDEESRRGETAKEAVIDAITHMGPAIGVAIITACLGFAALYFSPVPMIKDFGSMLIIGVIACYVLAIFFLMSILYSHDRRRTRTAAAKKAEANQIGFVEKGLGRLAPAIIKNPAVILSLALVLTIAGVIADGHIQTETDETKFISPNIPVIKDIKTLGELSSGGSMSANILVEGADISQPSTLEWMLQVESQTRNNPAGSVRGANSIADTVATAAGGTIPQNPTQIKGIIAALPTQVSSNLITSDFKAANIIISLNGAITGDQSRQLIETMKGYIAATPSGVTAVVTGSPVIQNMTFDALTGGRTRMTFIGIALVFCGLIFLFRFRLLRAIMATVPIALILGWSSGVMWLTGIKYNPLTSTLSALIIGIGVEFTILLMMRYYEERGNGEDPYTAMVTSMTKIGRAIVASGLTVMGGFGALLIARDFTILRDFGIVTMINVGFALISTLFVLPPLIVWIDSWQSKRKSLPQPPMSTSK